MGKMAAGEFFFLLYCGWPWDNLASKSGGSAVFSSFHTAMDRPQPVNCSLRCWN